MPKVRVNHFYDQHPPGSVVEMSEASAKQVIASRGGTLVKERAIEGVAETATEKLAEEAENRGGLSKAKARPEKR